MIECEFHPGMLLILPHIALTHGECSNPECVENHWRLTFGWVVGSIHFIF